MSEGTGVKRYTNKEVADLLQLVADILQILEANRFRIIAFQNGAEGIKNYPQDITAVHAAGKLLEIPGVGKGLAGAIGELLDKGIVAEFEDENPGAAWRSRHAPGAGHGTKKGASSLARSRRYQH
jgi:DNA polymerase/3'-5' exonuclease PolX